MTYQIAQTADMIIITYGSEKRWIKFNPARPLDKIEVTGDIKRNGTIWLLCKPWLHDTIKNLIHDALFDDTRYNAVAALFWLVTGIEVGRSEKE